MRPLLTFVLPFLAIIACTKVDCPPAVTNAPMHTPASTDGGSLQLPSQVVVVNATKADTVVNFAFGADSVVLPAAWPFCTASSALNCSFTLKADTAKILPSAGYLNVTLAFDAPVGCGSTKAELNVNNPNWYNTVDISLVDGYSNDVMIDYFDANGAKRLGPVLGKTGNAKMLGVFPLGCDICVARQKPSCGMTPSTDGCKAGTQYAPVPPCQYQGATMGGGASITVALVKPVPAAK